MSKKSRLCIVLRNGIVMAIRTNLVDCGRLMEHYERKSKEDEKQVEYTVRVYPEITDNVYIVVGCKGDFIELAPDATPQEYCIIQH